MYSGQEFDSPHLHQNKNNIFTNPSKWCNIKTEKNNNKNTTQNRKDEKNENIRNKVR